MLFIHLFPGLALLLLGAIFKKWPPKHINWLYGYRTKASMRNQHTWDEANRYAANLVFYYALVTIAIGIVFYFLMSFPMSFFMIIGILLVFLVLSILQTEWHLEKIFGDGM